ncbi:MAG: YfhO family protein [Clostridiales bacterium]|nr:YfhO family protein [Clostridiales bacterium]
MIEKNTLKTRSSFSAFNIAPYLSALSTLAMLTIVFLFMGIAPFGSNTILVSDLSIQYAPFLLGYKEHILSGEMLSYSFLFGMGKNTLGLFAYYLSSPFNFITFLFPKGMISQAVVLMIMLRLALSAAFLTIFLQNRSGIKDKMSAVFGAMYALSSYAIVYMVNIIWLDGFMLLPLLLLFVEQYLEDNRKWPRIVLLLFYLFVANFYIAYIVGVFSFIYLVIRMIENYRPGNDGKKIRRVIFRYIGLAILSAGLSAMILLPAGLDTLRNPDYRSAELTLSSRFVITDVLNQLFSGTFDSLHSNKPYLYAGLITTFLIILYFMNPGIAKRSKAVFATLLAFFVLSFHMSLLDYAWHLFDLPNWFQYRNAFALVLITILYAYLSFTKRGTLTARHCVKAGIVLLSMMIFVHVLGDMRNDGFRFYLNLIFGILYFLAVLGLTIPKWPESVSRLQKLALPALVVFIVFDVAIANPKILRPQALGYPSAPVAKQSTDISNAQALVAEAADEMDDEKIDFYRIEVDDIIRSIEASSAGSILGTRSISNFQSASNKHLHRFLKQLGFATNYNYFACSHSYTSVVPDSLFGISYILSESDRCAGLEFVSSSAKEYPLSARHESSDAASGLTEDEETDHSEIFLFKNMSALPLVYTVRADASEYDYYSLETDTDEKDYFQFQNRWLSSLFEAFPEGHFVYYPANRVEKAIFNAIESDQWMGEYDARNLIDWDTLGEEPVEPLGEGMMYYYQINPDAKMAINYEVTIESQDPLYVAIPFLGCGFEAQLLVNGELVDGYNRSHYTMITYLGTFSPGERIAVSVVFDKEQSVVSNMGADFYYCDTQKFAELLKEQDPASGITNLKAENGRVSATVSLDEDRLLLTTVPYEHGWTLWVDGEETEIEPYQDALISVPLAAGTHTVKLEFEAPGLMTGLIISLISAGAFLAILITRKVLKREKSE